jgi:hypothetical protein
MIGHADLRTSGRTHPGTSGRTPTRRAVRAAIASVPAAAWTAIRYPQAIWDDDGQCWISDAELAETSYTMGADTRRALTCRLVVPPRPGRQPARRD